MANEKPTIPDVLPENVEIPDPFADGKEPVTPTANGILVRPDDASDRTSGGLILPKNAQKAQLRGKVVAVGPGVFDARGERLPLDMQVGDIVLWGLYAGLPIKINGIRFLRLSANEVTLVVKDPTAKVENAEMDR